MKKKSGWNAAAVCWRGNGAKPRQPRRLPPNSSRNGNAQRRSAAHPAPCRPKSRAQLRYLTRAGAGWPANTGIRTPTQVEPLAGGFVEMDNEDVAVYSAYGAKIRTIQPGYARPALAVGNTRFVLYNRAGKELTVQSRTRQLYAKSFNNAICCAKWRRTAPGPW